MTNNANEALTAATARTMEVNRIANLLMETWRRVDPDSGVAKAPASYVATFADMARAVVDDRASAKVDDGALREALAWYGEQARLARLIHSEGDAGRHALANDGGKRAHTALSAPAASAREGEA